jgi:hypothetical protein
MSGWGGELTPERRAARVRGGLSALTSRRFARLFGIAGHTASMSSMGDPGRPHRHCRFPLWPDGETPNDRFCRSPAAHGTSWCDRHLDRVYTAEAAALIRRRGRLRP